MTGASDQSLLAVLLDSWERNNLILVNLLHALPEGGLDARAVPDSPSVAELLTHVCYVRLVFVSEDAPEFAVAVPQTEWREERNRVQIANMLNESAKVVRTAVQGRLEKGMQMDLHYDHPLLFLQHMIWHEGYHHGQIKLALKATGQPLSDEVAGPVSWDLWMDKH